MRFNERARSVALACSAAGILVLAACGSADSRVEQLTSGIATDSVLTILNDGTRPAPGETPHAISSGSMLVNGANYTILFYSPSIESGMTAGDVSRDEVTPLVIQNGVLVGWGWEFFNNLASQTHFATPEFRQ